MLIYTLLLIYRINLRYYLIPKITFISKVGRSVQYILTIPITITIFKVGRLSYLK
jgi:hypothetical protein